MPIRLHDVELLVSLGAPPGAFHDFAGGVTGLANGGFALTYLNSKYFTRVYDGFGAITAGPTGIGSVNGGVARRDGGIAELANGRLVETFSEHGPVSGDSIDIAFAHFLPDLTDFSPIANPGPNGPTYQVSLQYNPAIASSSKGGFLLAWDDEAASYGRPGQNVIVQFFDNAGAPVQPAFVASENIFSDKDQRFPDATDLKNGSYVVVWQDDGGLDDSGAGIRARKFTAGGDVASAEIPVNHATAGPQTDPAVAKLAGGGFVVVWESAGEIVARAFKANGAPASGDIAVSRAPAGVKTDPDVTGLADGGFLVAWVTDAVATADGGDGSGTAIKARAFSATGAPTSDELLVNSTTNWNQNGPAVATLIDGRVVATWTDESNALNSGYEARAQNLDPRSKGVQATGTDGPDKYLGSDFADVFDGGKGNDNLLGLAGADVLKGKAGKDNLQGGKGEDRLEGDKGDDLLFGGLDKDIILGGAGKDKFLFAKKLEGGAKADRLADFSPDDDRILLDNAIFKKLTSEGPLAAKHFRNAEEAKDGNDYVYHNPNNGGVYYDANGDKKGGATMFAIVDKGLELSADNFLVV